MSIARDDRWVTDAQGRALSGAQVYYCAPQPASTGANPPSPLATIYSDMNGTPQTNPVITDGFGHSVAYLTEGVLYTVAVYHPLFGPNPVVLTDQVASSSSFIPFEGIPAGTIDGTNHDFVLTNAGIPLTKVPSQVTVWKNFPLIVNDANGYTLSGVTITYAVAPTSGDSLYAQGQF